MSLLGLPAGLTDQGAWSSLTAYVANIDVVLYNDRYFKSIQNGTNHTPPDGELTSSNAYWELLGLPTPSTKITLASMTPVNAVAATGTVTVAAGQPADGNTVTINGQVYTFKTALSVGPAVPYEVLIGVDADATALNLKKAVNAEAGAGTNYSTGTVINPVVTATVLNNVVTLTSKIKGTIGNTYTLAKVGANLSVSGAVLAGGVDGTPTSGNHVAADASYLYVSLLDNTVNGANWKRAALSSF